jgi:hypothetical protein
VWAFDADRNGFGERGEFLGFRETARLRERKANALNAIEQIERASGRTVVIARDLLKASNHNIESGAEIVHRRMM